MKTELFGALFGELQPRSIYAVYGVPNVGKTLLTMTEVAALQAQGVRTLWIDTEGGLNFEGGPGLWESWKPKLEARYGLKELNSGIEYHRFMDYEELLQWLGYNVHVEYDEKKTTVLFRGKVTARDVKTVYDDFGRKKDNCLIVLDSLSSIFRLQFGSTMQNFPSRGDATGYLIFALEKLMLRTNSPIITTNHASLNPQQPWQPATIRGGATVGYYSKNIAYLEKPKKWDLDTYRKMYAVRSPNAKEWGAEVWTHIDGDKGFVMSNEDEITAVLKAAKEAKKQAKGEDEE